MTADRDLEPTRHHRWLVAHESRVKAATAAFVVVFVGAAVAVTVLDGARWTSWLTAVGVALSGTSVWLSIGSHRRHIEQWDLRHAAPPQDGPGQ